MRSAIERWRWGGPWRACSSAMAMSDGPLPPGSAIKPVEGSHRDHPRVVCSQPLPERHRSVQPRRGSQIPPLHQTQTPNPTDTLCFPDPLRLTSVLRTQRCGTSLSGSTSPKASKFTWLFRMSESSKKNRNVESIQLLCRALYSCKPKASSLAIPTLIPPLILSLQML